ncbi:MAG: efflux RND transporter periplasmic adaptor subunit [Bacteroidia bacterium]|nr:efflux RND transporter periplasmic adaptor subunit [Bacteroidia bacterium]
MKTSDYALSLLLVAASGFIVASCHNPAKRGCYEKSAVKVRTLTVQTQSGVSGKTYVARVDASKSIVLTSPLPATLVGIDVRQGDKVREGQVVARVKAESAENALAAAAATLRQARDANDRLESVKDNGSVSEVKLIEAQTRLAQAQAAYNQALKAVEDCSIRAPYAGTVSEVYLSEGERVVLEKPILRIVDASSLELVIAVPEGEMGEMGIGRKAVLTVPALGNAVTGAKLVRRGVDASPLSHTYDCVLLPDAKVEGLLPGMVGKIVFEDPEAAQIVIPASAVRTGADGRYVWTVDESGCVRKTKVSTGGFSGRGVVVTEGLSEGERLVVEGMSKISSGMKVEVL